MSKPLVECIPNFSEARRPEVVEAIVKSITDVTGVHVLDRHSDMDHNRTVITFLGTPEVVEEAAFQAIATAANLIDLNHHTGEHPRLGATDVVPFVPIAEISMAECVQIARRLGERVSSQLDIPVYLYEEAATRPERQNLEYIRHGEYEGVKAEIATNPDRAPDFGPAELGPAGATVIGARQPLIAFNVYLTTDQVSVANKIARAVRYSSGGMHFVKALGMLVEGRAQVSMNLTNYRQTPIFRVVEMIRREAEHYGVAIHHTELVGLIPQEALTNAALWYLQLGDFQTDQILEQRLYALMVEQAQATTSDTPGFLDQLAAATPTPGGGCAAAHTGAAAAALVSMVCRLTLGKKKYAAVENEMLKAIERSEDLRAQLDAAVAKDAAAFETVMAAYKLPKETQQQQEIRSAAIEKAMQYAAEVPLDVARKAVEVMRMAAWAAANGNINAISDAGSAVALSRAALTAAGLNVRINTKGLQDPSNALPLLDELIQIEAGAAQIETEMHATLINRGGLKFG